MLVFPAITSGPAGCNVNVGGASSVTTVVDHTDSATGTHLRLIMTAYSVRAALGEAPNTAAYVTIKNEGNAPDRLVSAACDCSAAAHLHTMVMQGGQMIMDEPKDGFPIAPGQSVVFAPGGNHIMLSNLKTRPQAGGVQTVTLTFEKAGSVPVAMPVSDAPQTN
ncbi:MAG: copper chaperone PCu(A)C [Asticcacaulis sp.]